MSDSREPGDRRHLDVARPEKAADYFYQVRSNLSPRGKGAWSDGEIVRQSLITLLAVFKEMLSSIEVSYAPKPGAPCGCIIRGISVRISLRSVQDCEPRADTVHVYRPTAGVLEPVTRLTRQDTLTLPLVPGFTCAVGPLFAECAEHREGRTHAYFCWESRV